MVEIIKKKNSELFTELEEYIENRRKFSNTELENLIQNFKNYCNKNKKILISQETWITSYQKNKITNKMEIVSWEVKLKNLLFILDKINIPYKFFFIQRDLKTSIQSFYATLHERIRLLFGKKFLSFNFFLDHINKKKSGYKDLLLLLDTFNLKKITKVIPKNKIQLFDYEDLLNNKEKFINDLSNYLEIKINKNLLNKLSTFTRVTKKIKQKTICLKRKTNYIIY